jgi:hypothetical protein
MGARLGTRVSLRQGRNMPIHIKPEYKLKPCMLNLNNIEEITRILSNSFPEARFSANRNPLQIFDEPRESFLEIISDLESIESFIAFAQGNIEGKPLKLQLEFSEKQAKVIFDAIPEHETWIEHFLIDLKKQLIPQSIIQKISGYFDCFFTLDSDGKSGPFGCIRPYCRFALKQEPPNSLVENIKANLLSNIIWAIAGMIFLYIIQWAIKIFELKSNT